MAWTPFLGGPVYPNAPVTSGVSISNSSGAAQAASDASSFIDRAIGISQANNAWSASQAKTQRKWQEQQNAKAMQFSAAEAAKNRDWQKYMSNTAHQREVKDLMAAGLNPILSAMGGNGAAVGTGATAAGVTSAGAKGDIDTSANAAIAGLLGSFLQAQTQLQSMTTSALSNLAVADKYTAMERYAADLSASTAVTTAGINAAAQRYVSDNNLTGSLANAAANKISAAIHAEASKYTANKNYLSSQNVANINARVNRELKEMGIKANFDFAEKYPNNEWQYSPGQANAREWATDIGGILRDIGVAAGGFAQWSNRRRK